VTAYWGVVAAAGVGRRLGSSPSQHGARANPKLARQEQPKPKPKQYIKIANATLLEHSIKPLLACQQLDKIVVALNAADTHWQQLPLQQNPAIESCHGGASRAQSVHNALRQLSARAAAADWVIVHDAVRPCLTLDELQRFMRFAEGDASGALVAIAINDSIKRVHCGGDATTYMAGTMARSTRLVRAATPQMFRYGLLSHALDKALADAINIDDEAAAMHHAGHRVKVMLGSYQNIKVTYRADLAVAAHYLSGG